MQILIVVGLAAALSACLDATTGDRLSDVPDAPDAPSVPDAGAPEVAPTSCPAGASLAFIARDTGAFAVGPCGALAYWKEREGRSLELLAGTHERVASYSDPNGFSGTVRFSPSGRRVVATSLRSDLGFGDVRVGAFPSAPPFVVDATLDFGGTVDLVFAASDRIYALAHGGIGDPSDWVRIEDGVDLGPADGMASADDDVFYTLATSPAPASGADATVHHLNITTGLSGPVTELRRAWVGGSTMRSRQGFVVTGDGTRVVVTNECKAFGRPSCTTNAERIVDVATGAVLVDHLAWRAPRTGAGPLVAGDSDAGAVLVDATGVVVTLPDHKVVAVLADELLTTHEGDLYVVRGANGSEPSLVAREFVRLEASPGGRSAAIRAGAGPEGASGLVLWVDHQAVAVAGEPFTTAIVAVFDDGVTLVSSGTVVSLIGPDGATRRTWPGSCARNPLRRGASVFFEHCAAPNDELQRFDLESGEDASLAEGHDFVFDVDLSGAYLAFTFVPLSGTQRELHAGRIAP